MKQQGNTAARNPKVVIIGGGMSGMLMGIRLKQAGIESFEILEKAETIGGTWRENTYPGLSCDVPAYMYAYSFEPNTDCSRRYARGPEIQQYFLRVYQKYRLESHTRLNTTVESAHYEDGGWTVTTSDGLRQRADIVISATGVLHHPSYPDIPGLDSFAGATMHSARWDHGVALNGKRIGIVGAGSTAVQIVCGLVEQVGQLSLFQRTAQWIAPSLDAEYGEWRKPFLRRAPWLARLFHGAYSELWQRTAGHIADSKLMLGFMDKICRLNLELSVRDPVLREKLRPDYRAGCKRLVLSDEFYRSIQQPNARLVTEGIERIEPRGIRTRDGKLHELDVLVLATGFKAFAYMRHIKVVGPQGRNLDEAWSEGATAYRTVTVAGFPNLFLMQGPHSPVGNFSLISISEVQANYIMQLVEWFRRGQCQTIEPQATATQQYNQALQSAVQGTVWASGCKSWYLDKNGRPALWPWSYKRFEEELQRPRLEDFQLSH